MRNRWLRWAVLALALFAWPAVSRADYHKERDLRLEPGGRFVLDASAGSVTIRGSSGSGAHVVITSSRDDLENLFDFNFEEGALSARVKARRRSYSWTWFRGLNLHFDIRVPEATSVEVKTGGGSIEASDLRRAADLETSGGSIRVADLGSELRAHTSGGSIHLQNVSGNARVETSGGGIEAESVGGSLEARTSGGSIQIRDVKGALLARTSGGSIRIEGARAKVDAHTSGGSVQVVFSKGNAHGGDIETSGGGVRVAVDPSVNLDVDASASGGSIKCDLPITVSGSISGSHVYGKLNGGGETLHVRSSAGPVRIEAL
jgi:DUF4097 and DUF4098 domain-containing protein YvlB